MEAKNITKENDELLRVAKASIDHAATIEYHKKFLEITGLKVGDLVEAYFSVSSGNSKRAFQSLRDTEAILKQRDNGELYIESVQKLPTAHSRSNNYTGRSRRDWWEFENVIMTANISQIRKTESNNPIPPSLLTREGERK